MDLGECTPPGVCIVSGETSEGPVRGAACSPWVLGVLQPRPGAVAGTLNIGAGWAPGLVLLTCVLLAGAEAKTILPKKEKLKLRRERWLQSKLPRPVLSCPVLSCPWWTLVLGWLRTRPLGGLSPGGGGGLRYDRQMAP